MKIGIDARFFGPRDKGPGRYTQKLIENLEKIDPPARFAVRLGSTESRRESRRAGEAGKKNQYFIFLRKSRWSEYKTTNSNFKKVLANYQWYGWKEQILFPFKIQKYKIDLMHFTHFNAPILYRRNFIVTIHDLILRRFPTSRKNLRNFLFYPFKNSMYKLAFRQAVKRAKKIIAVSQYTKKEILKYYPAGDGAGKINPDKIKIIYEGVTD